VNKWLPSELGAEPRKLAILIGLLVLAVGAYFYGNSSTAPVTTIAPAPRASVPVALAPPIVPQRVQTRTKSKSVRDEDFHPTLKLPDDFDLSKVDPTLRTDLLARVRQIGDVGGSRSLFEFYTPPPPPPPKVDPIKPTEAVKASPPVEFPKPVETGPAPPPPPAPIPLKYFGYEGTPRAGRKLRALFVDGEEHFVVGEGELIRGRYRVVRIGTTSAEVEDMTGKNTQTVRILERQDP
jgi:hypothetical protein